MDFPSRGAGIPFYNYHIAMLKGLTIVFDISIESSANLPKRDSFTRELEFPICSMQGTIKVRISVTTDEGCSTP